MGEYAAAKAAGEIVCQFLQKNHREMTIYSPRLPRMATDQTVTLLPLTLLPVNNLDPVPIMIKVLRCFRDQ
jgi:hypothetical protein